MTPLDVIVFAWVATVVSATYAGLPLLIRQCCAPAARPDRIGLIASLLLTSAAGVALLSAFSLVNPISVVLLHMAWAAAVLVRSYGSVGNATERFLRVAAELDEAPAGTCRGIAAAEWERLDSRLDAVMSRISRPQMAAFGLMVSALLIARVLPALSEARLFHPLAYDELYLVRRILAGTLAQGIAPPFAAWTAAVVTLSAVDAAFIVRFVPPLLASALTAGVIWSSARLSRRSDVAIVTGLAWLIAQSGFAAAFPWGEALARQHAALGEYLSAAVVLLLLGSRSSSRATPIAAVALLCPALAPVAAAATAPSWIRLELTALTWLVTAGAGLNPSAPLVLRAVAPTMPVAVALACAALYRSVSVLDWLPDPARAVAWGLVAMLAGSGVAPPHVVIEPDSVARQAIRMVRDAPRGHWTIVGRSMPLLRGYPAVQQEASAAATSTFVIVQKRPLETFEEAGDQATLMAAERAVHQTPGARIYDDDDSLRIYRLPAWNVESRVAYR